MNLEYGIAIPQGALKVKSHLLSIIDDKENELTISSRELMQELYDELVELEGRLKKLASRLGHFDPTNLATVLAKMCIRFAPLSVSNQ